MKHIEVIEKIKKLLARAESSNDNESQIAMAIATGLLARYNLSLRDVEGRSINEKNSKDKFFGTLIPLQNGHTVFQYWVANILKDHFYVYVLQSTKDNGDVFFKILGEYHNVEVAWYVYHSLERQFCELWERHQSKTHCLSTDYESFISGLYYGLDTTLCSEKLKISNSKALVAITDELKAYGKAVTSGVDHSLGIGDDRSSKYNRNVVNDGKAASKEIKIFSALKSDPSAIKKIA